MVMLKNFKSRKGGTKWRYWLGSRSGWEWSLVTITSPHALSHFHHSSPSHNYCLCFTNHLLPCFGRHDTLDYKYYFKSLEIYTNRKRHPIRTPHLVNKSQPKKLKSYDRGCLVISSGANLYKGSNKKLIWLEINRDNCLLKLMETNVLISWSIVNCKLSWQ